MNIYIAFLSKYNCRIVSDCSQSKENVADLLLFNTAYLVVVDVVAAAARKFIQHTVCV